MHGHDNVIQIFWLLHTDQSFQCFNVQHNGRNIHFAYTQRAFSRNKHESLTNQTSHEICRNQGWYNLWFWLLYLWLSRWWGVWLFLYDNQIYVSNTSSKELKCNNPNKMQLHINSHINIWLTCCKESVNRTFTFKMWNCILYTLKTKTKYFPRI